ALCGRSPAPRGTRGSDFCIFKCALYQNGAPAIVRSQLCSTGGAFDFRGSTLKDHSPNPGGQCGCPRRTDSGAPLLDGVLRCLVLHVLGRDGAHLCCCIQVRLVACLRSAGSSLFLSGATLFSYRNGGCGGICDRGHPVLENICAGNHAIPKSA